MKEKTTGRAVPECPFGQEKLESATVAFLANPSWKDVYDDVPRANALEAEAERLDSERKEV